MYYELYTLARVQHYYPANRLYLPTPPSEFLDALPSYTPHYPRSMNAPVHAFLPENPHTLLLKRGDGINYYACISEQI